MRLWKVALHNEEDGNALLLFFLFFFIFIGIAGLVIDMGIVYKTKIELRKVANAAVLSGAQELPNSETAVRGVVSKILTAHGESGSLKEVLVKPNGENKVKVTLAKDVPLGFMKLFHMNSVRVSLSSTAALAPLSRAVGAAPLGIDSRVTLEYMKEYKLKVDAGSGAYGNYGILALSGPGANLYEQDLMYGYKNELKIGDVVNTQTGNVAGKTREGVNFRISSSQYATDDYTHRDDPRIILILVYEPYEISSNQLKSVKICGFAYFYLKQPMSSQDTEITGYFIQRVGVGEGSVSTKDNGAYSIRLVE